jgi:hypothetical protein
MAQRARYEHSQIGTTLLAITGITVAIIGGRAAVLRDRRSLAAVTMSFATAILAAVASVFWRMTIAVTDRDVRWRLGFGWPGQVIAGEQILSCAPLRTSGLGYGIRTDGRRTMWLVSGRDAVAITLRSGKVVALGTPDADGLRRAIDDLIERMREPRLERAVVHSWNGRA